MPSNYFINNTGLQAHNQEFLLFSTTDTLWLRLPSDGKLALSSMLREYLGLGFYVEAEQTSLVSAGVNSIVVTDDCQ